MEVTVAWGSPVSLLRRASLPLAESRLGVNPSNPPRAG